MRYRDSLLIDTQEQGERKLCRLSSYKKYSKNSIFLHEIDSDISIDLTQSFLSELQ